MERILDYSICCVKGCDTKSLALGLCNKHWQRTRKYGSPVATESHSGMYMGKSAAHRFEMQHRKTDGCWLWSASTDTDGYGAFRGEYDGVIYKRAHRWSWAYHNKQHIPPGGHVCHKCDTPGCVNPDHLFLGDAEVNQADKMAKGRHRVQRGETAGRAKLTEAQARAILADPRPYTTIAFDYGVTRMTVNDIKRRVSWQHITDVEIPPKPARVSPRKGKSDKITPEIVREIRTSKELGKALAERFGISQQHISGIRKGRGWAHIE
jgi:hypothetical protein